MTDSSVLLAMIKKISNHYKIDYREILVLCNIDDSSKPKRKPVQLEYITMNTCVYLYDHHTNQVYTDGKTPKLIGKLCKDTCKLITI